MDKIADDVFTLKLIKQENEMAFKGLFELYFAPLCRFVCFFIKDSKISEDIVLDIFISLWENRKTLQIQATLKAYLFQSARNRALNYIRDNERFVTVDNFSPWERFENDDSLETRELQHLIQEAILSLPPKCKEIFNKSRIEERSNKEIANQMNISIKAVEAQITRALRIIRAYLDDSYLFF